MQLGVVLFNEAHADPVGLSVLILIFGVSSAVSGKNG